MNFSYILANTNNFSAAKIIAAVSVIFFTIYIVMSIAKYKVKKASQPKGVELSSHDIIFGYGESREKCVLRFYTDGMLFQKSDYKNMFVPYGNISAIDKVEEEENTYRISFFMPNGRESVTVYVISDVSLDEELDFDIGASANENNVEEENE